MNVLEKANFVGQVFIGGVKKQLEQEWVWETAAAIGLYQGLKYTGSIKRGIVGGVAALAVISGANGMSNVVAYWDKIKKVLEEQKEADIEWHAFVETNYEKICA